MKTILGNSPITTIVGLALAGLTAAQTLLQQGQTNYYQIGMAALMAILGRVAADSNSITPKQ